MGDSFKSFTGHYQGNTDLVDLKMDELRHIEGTLVGAKLTKNDTWWPGIVINPERCGLTYNNSNEECIFWFGDHRASMVNIKNVFYLEECLDQILNRKSGILLTRGVLESLKVFASRLGVPTSTMTEKGLLEWGSSISHCVSSQHSTPVDIPFEVRVHLQIIKDKVHNAKSTKNKSSGTINNEKKKDYFSDYTLKQIRKWRKCTSCLCANAHHKHPIFNVPLCEKCLVDYQENFFYIGDDGIKHCCTVCGSYGILLICSNIKCCSTYCKQCVEKYLGKNRFNVLARMSKWSCFLCVPLVRENVLNVRTNWKENISVLYLHGGSEREKKKFNYKSISTVVSVSYYEQEIINENYSIILKMKNIIRCQIQVPNKEDKYNTLPKGGLRKLFSNDIGKIDFIMGSAEGISKTWNEEDIPIYLKLCTEFYHMVKILNRKNPELYWMFESPCFASSVFQKEISRLLNTRPMVFYCHAIDCQQTKYRSLWSNFSTAPKMLKELYKHYF